MLVFGIDGGGTRSALVALDGDGQPRLHLEGGALLLDPADPAARADPIAALAGSAAERLGARLPVAALCVAVAGAGRTHMRKLLADALRGRGLADAVEVTTDADAALYDAFGETPGVLVIAGTGSVVRARTTDGRTLRVGGWGQLLGDEGSGYAIGLAVLRAVAHAEDGRSDDAALAAPVLAATGCASADHLVRWAAHASKGDIAGLAELAFHTPGPVAASIIRHAAEELAGQVHAALARGAVWPAPVPLACAGGLIAPGRPLREPLLRALAGHGHDFRVGDRPVDGARGAARLALRLAGERRA